MATGPDPWPESASGLRVQQRTMDLRRPGGGSRADRPADRRLARPARPLERMLRRRPANQPDHRRHARLLRQRRRRTRASGRWRRHDHAQLSGRPGAIPIPATLSIELGKRISAHDGVREIPLRLGSAVQGTRAARARRIREGRARGAARQIPKQPDHRGLGLAAQPARPRRRAGHHGAGLRRPATTRTRTARRRTGKSATCAASRRYRSPSRSPRTSSRSSILLGYFVLAAARA